MNNKNKYNNSSRQYFEIKNKAEKRGESKTECIT